MVSAIAGSLEIPRNDDWSYRRIATEFARTGELVLDGAAQTMLIGQIAIAQPFLWISNAQPWAFTVAGALFATAAVCSAYALARQLVEPQSAAICALLVLVFPGFLAYATSFMSDAPAVAAQWACLAAAGVAIRRRPFETRWLLVSLGIGVVGFSIREFAIAAPAAVLAGLMLAEPRRSRTWVLAGAVFAVAAAMLLWRAGLPGQLGTVSPRPATFDRVPLALSSTTMVLLPAALVALARRRRRWHRLDVLIGANVGLVLLLPRLLDAATNVYLPDSVMENLTTRWGVPWPDYILGGRPVLIADAAWWLLNLLALVSTPVVTTIAAATLGEHLRRVRPRPRNEFVRQLGSAPGVYFLYCASVAAGLIVYAVVLPLYDRYLWAVIPPASALLLYDPLPRRQTATSIDWAARGGAAVSGATLAALSLVFLLNSHAFDAARWRAGSRLVETGISPASIDAGYEWMGYHATTRATAADRLPARIWYEGWWPDFRLCGFASSTADIIPDARLLGTVDYRLYLIAGPAETIHLYEVGAPNCG